MLDKNVREDIEGILKEYVTNELADNNIIEFDETAIETMISDALDTLFQEIDDGVSEIVDNATTVGDDGNVEEENDSETENKNDRWKDCY